MSDYNYLDLFHGIGGFAYGAYLAGMKFKNHLCSDIEPYCQKLYKLRFPDSIQLGDVKKINYEELKNKYGKRWIVSGGFPCQPHSQAGKRKASKDERDLWPECFRMFRELRPEVALFENVPGLFTSDGGRFFNGVLSDIASVGYDCEWTIISAKDAGAPHLRERVWIVAYANDSGYLQRQNEIESTDGWKYAQYNISTESQDVADTSGKGLSKSTCSGFGSIQSQVESFERSKSCRGNAKTRTNWSTEPDVGRLAHGISHRVDRLKGLGNSIVPQIAELLFRQIKKII